MIEVNDELEDNYSPIAEIRNLEFQIEIEQDKIKQATKQLIWLKQKRDYLHEAQCNRIRIREERGVKKYE